jgi:uncharacterized membrane protein (DUF2068 family)
MLAEAPRPTPLTGGLCELATQPTTPQSPTIRRSGWITFAGTLTIITGALNALDGFVALYRATYFKNIFVFGNIQFWSLVLLVFGAVQILAGVAILSARGWGRWFGIVTVSINALAQLSVISAYPFSAAAIIAYDLAILYALTARWRTRSVFATGS